MFCQTSKIDLSDFWIGLVQDGYGGYYVWIDGSTLTYVNWWAGEPNDYNGQESCVVMNNLYGMRLWSLLIIHSSLWTQWKQSFCLHHKCVLVWRILICGIIRVCHNRIIIYYFFDVGLWNDDNCGRTHGYVCKKLLGSTPGTVAPTPSLPGGCPDVSNWTIAILL